MRYLRMLTNAVAGGVLGAMYLAVLVLQLNPQVSIASETAVRWFNALLGLYGPFLSVAIFFLMLTPELLVSQPLRPAWLSVRLLAWLGAAGAAAAAAITWANLEGYRTVLTADAAERMRQGAVATTTFAVVLVAIAVLRYSFGRRGSRATGAVLAASMFLSVAVPLWFRGPGGSPVPVARGLPPVPEATGLQPVPLAGGFLPLRGGALPPRVRLLLVDGASLGFIRQRVAAGQLPNFGRLLDLGAAIDLATLKPTQAEPVWAAAATGKFPPKNGIRSAALYRVESDPAIPVDLLPDYCFASALVDQEWVRETDATADGLTARPLWDVLADYGIAAGVVDWPLTYPAEVERGYIVSDDFDELVSSPLRLADSLAAYPTTAVESVRGVFTAWLGRPWQDVVSAGSPAEPQPDGLLSARWDRAYSEAARDLDQQFAPRLTAVRYEGIDVFGHNYLDDAQPELFGGVPRDGPVPSVLDRHYGFLDAEVGRELSRLRSGDLLVVVSGYGMVATTWPKRLLARLLGTADPSGTHEPAPDGFLAAYGTNVAQGQFSRGSIVDLAPTVLYYMGLPVGRDMDGFARTDLFLRSYTRDRPVEYVRSHER